MLANKTRILLKERGQPMIVDAQLKYDAGLLEERDYNILVAQSKMLDRDAGLKV